MAWSETTAACAVFSAFCADRDARLRIGQGASFCAWVRFCCACCVLTLAPVDVGLDCACADLLAGHVVATPTATTWALFSAVCAVGQVALRVLHGHLVGLDGRGDLLLAWRPGWPGRCSALCCAFCTATTSPWLLWSSAFWVAARLVFASSSAFCAFWTASWSWSSAAWTWSQLPWNVCSWSWYACCALASAVWSACKRGLRLVLRVLQRFLAGGQRRLCEVDVGLGGGDRGGGARLGGVQVLLGAVERGLGRVDLGLGDRGLLGRGARGDLGQVGLLLGQSWPGPGRPRPAGRWCPAGPAPGPAVTCLAEADVELGQLAASS